MADLHHLGRIEGMRRDRRSCSTGSTWSRRRGKPAATYSGGDASTARPRDDPGRRPADHLPRRADHRPRPAQPPHVWRIIRELVDDGVTIFLTTHYLEEADQLADRVAVLDQREADRRRDPRRAQAPHPRRARPPAVRRPDGPWRRRPRSFPGSARDEDAPRPCRSRATATSDRSTTCSIASIAASIEVESLSVHTPDLDDVFLALTGEPDRKGGPSRMSTLAYAIRDSATMLRRNFRHMRCATRPSRFVVVGDPGRSSCSCSSTCSAARSAPGSASPRAAAAAYVDYVVPGILLMAVAGAAAGDRDLGLDGHDRGHHRPLPHDGDRARLGADRSRPRQHDPDDARPGGGDRRRPGGRLPAQRLAGRVDRGGRRAR